MEGLDLQYEVDVLRGGLRSRPAVGQGGGQGEAEDEQEHREGSAVFRPARRLTAHEDQRDTYEPGSGRCPEENRRSPGAR